LISSLFGGCADPTIANLVALEEHRFAEQYSISQSGSNTVAQNARCQDNSRAAYCFGETTPRVTPIHFGQSRKTVRWCRHVIFLAFRTSTNPQGCP
jgi:hypothetical protein